MVVTVSIFSSSPSRCRSRVHSATAMPHASGSAVAVVRGSGKREASTGSVTSSRSSSVRSCALFGRSTSGWYLQPSGILVEWHHTGQTVRYNSPVQRLGASVRCTSHVLSVPSKEAPALFGLDFCTDCMHRWHHRMYNFGNSLILEEIPENSFQISRSSFNTADRDFEVVLPSAR